MLCANDLVLMIKTMIGHHFVYLSVTTRKSSVTHGFQPSKTTPPSFLSILMDFPQLHLWAFKEYFCLLLPAAGGGNGSFWANILGQSGVLCIGIDVHCSVFQCTNGVSLFLSAGCIKINYSNLRSNCAC